MICADANLKAAAAMQAAAPRIVNICPAREAMPILQKMTLLHAGPPVDWQNMPDIQRGAVIGALLYENWAKTPEGAVRLAAEGKINLVPCNDVDAVGGLAGITSPSMPVVVAVSVDGHHRAYCRLWEPFLVFGHHDSKTLQSLKWLESVFAPALKHGIERAGAVEISALIASALQMGDDTHSRKAAISLLLLKSLLLAMIRAQEEIPYLNEVMDFWLKYDAVSLSFVIAAAKVMSMAAGSIKGSSVITVICSNGFEMGIQLSGTGKRWFTGPAPIAVGRQNVGIHKMDVSPVIGDSPIAEVVGLGGCALAAAPTAPSNVSGNLESAIQFSLEARQVAVTQNLQWRIPALGDSGNPLGLDARKCLDLSISPPLAVTIPSVKAGSPPLGAGIARVDLELIKSAVKYLDEINSDKYTCM